MAEAPSPSSMALPFVAYSWIKYHYVSALGFIPNSFVLILRLHPNFNAIKGKKHEENKWNIVYVTKSRWRNIVLVYQVAQLRCNGGRSRRCGSLIALKYRRFIAERHIIALSVREGRGEGRVGKWWNFSHWLPSLRNGWQAYRDLI